ncbi:hypothetical protein E2C01_040203 [Portunus trituberculatus]|uniref:Uncharacterized protein n=1 Tax=Portunus trituberculatus TaxID=210409 RepID=A0A5B7FN56_PORTR|nr:hypothetical protein [Portunus trituberculatus]
METSVRDGFSRTGGEVVRLPLGIASNSETFPPTAPSSVSVSPPAVADEVSAARDEAGAKATMVRVGQWTLGKWGVESSVVEC